MAFINCSMNIFALVLAMLCTKQKSKEIDESIMALEQWKICIVRIHIHHLISTFIQYECILFTKNTINSTLYTIISAVHTTQTIVDRWKELPNWNEQPMIKIQSNDVKSYNEHLWQNAWRKLSSHLNNQQKEEKKINGKIRREYEANMHKYVCNELSFVL